MRKLTATGAIAAGAAALTWATYRKDMEAARRRIDTERQVNGLGVDTRGDRIDHLSKLMAKRGVEPVGWYGVRLFTDGWTPDRVATDPEDLVLEAELIASQRDPYRRLSRLFHLIGRRPA